MRTARRQEYASVKPGQRNVMVGSRGDDVKKLQEFFSLPQTGEFCPVLMERVVDFQRRRNLIADGQVTRCTWKAAGFIIMKMFPLNPDEFFGMEGEFYGRTRKIQKHIKLIQDKLGIAPTGVYDDSMKVAVMRWQGIKGLPKTGRFGERDWSELF